MGSVDSGQASGIEPAEIAAFIHQRQERIDARGVDPIASGASG